MSEALAIIEAEDPKRFIQQVLRQRMEAARIVFGISMTNMNDPEHPRPTTQYWTDQIGDWDESWEAADVYNLNDYVHDGVLDLNDCPFGAEKIYFVDADKKVVKEVPLTDDVKMFKIIDTYEPDQHDDDMAEWNPPEQFEAEDPKEFLQRASKWVVKPMAGTKYIVGLYYQGKEVHNIGLNAHMPLEGSGDPGVQRQVRELTALGLMRDNNDPQYCKELQHYLNWLQVKMPCPDLESWVTDTWLREADAAGMPEKFTQETGRAAFKREGKTGVMRVELTGYVREEAEDAKRFLQQHGRDFAYSHDGSIYYVSPSNNRTVQFIQGLNLPMGRLSGCICLNKPYFEQFLALAGEAGLTGRVVTEADDVYDLQHVVRLREAEDPKSFLKGYGDYVVKWSFGEPVPDVLDKGCRYRIVRGVSGPDAAIEKWKLVDKGLLAKASPDKLPKVIKVYRYYDKLPEPKAKALPVPEQPQAGNLPGAGGIAEPGGVEEAEDPKSVFRQIAARTSEERLRKLLTHDHARFAQVSCASNHDLYLSIETMGGHVEMDIGPFTKQQLELFRDEWHGFREAKWEGWDLAMAQAQPGWGGMESVASDIAKEADKAEEPKSPEEAEAGNYKKGHIRLHGFEIAIENAKDSVRKSKDPDNPWEVVCPAHYGYIKGTNGNDKDHLDVYIGEHPTSMLCFVVNQCKEESDKFDEHKIMLGFKSKDEAIETYKKAFNGDLGNKLCKTVVSATIDQLKHWLEKGDPKKEYANLEEAEDPKSVFRRLPRPEDWVVFFNDPNSTTGKRSLVIKHCATEDQAKAKWKRREESRYLVLSMERYSDFMRRRQQQEAEDPKSVLRQAHLARVKVPSGLLVSLQDCIDEIIGAGYRDNAEMVMVFKRAQEYLSTSEQIPTAFARQAYLEYAEKMLPILRANEFVIQAEDLEAAIETLCEIWYMPKPVRPDFVTVEALALIEAEDPKAFMRQLAARPWSYELEGSYIYIKFDGKTVYDFNASPYSAEDEKRDPDELAKAWVSYFRKLDAVYPYRPGEQPKRSVLYSQPDSDFKDWYAKAYKRGRSQVGEAEDPKAFMQVHLPRRTRWSYEIKRSPDGAKSHVYIKFLDTVVNDYDTSPDAEQETSDPDDLGQYWVNWYKKLDAICPYRPQEWPKSERSSSGFLDWYSKAYDLIHKRMVGEGEDPKDFLKRVAPQAQGNVKLTVYLRDGNTYEHIIPVTWEKERVMKARGWYAGIDLHSKAPAAPYLDDGEWNDILSAVEYHIMEGPSEGDGELDYDELFGDQPELFDPVARHGLTRRIEWRYSGHFADDQERMTTLMGGPGPFRRNEAEDPKTFLQGITRLTWKCSAFGMNSLWFKCQERPHFAFYLVRYLAHITLKYYRLETEDVNAAKDCLGTEEFDSDETLNEVAALAKDKATTFFAVKLQEAEDPKDVLRQASAAQPKLHLFKDAVYVRSVPKSEPPVMLRGIGRYCRSDAEEEPHVYTILDLEQGMAWHQKAWREPDGVHGERIFKSEPHAIGAQIDWDKLVNQIK